MPDEYEDIIAAGLGQPAPKSPRRPRSEQPLDLISHYESGDRNVRNYRYDPTHTAQGYYQITSTNWRNYGPRAGVDLQQHPDAMAAPREVQAKVADLMFKEQGYQPWAPYNARLRAALRQRTGSGTVKQPDGYDDVIKAALSPSSEQSSPPKGKVLTSPRRTSRTPVSAPSAPVSKFDYHAGRIDPRLIRQMQTQKPAPQNPLTQRLAQDRAIRESQRQQEEATREAVRQERRGRVGPYGNPTASGVLHLVANPIEGITGLFRSEDENVNRETTERLKQQQVAALPEVTEIRKEYGAMPAAVRSVAAPVIGRGGSGLLKVAGGVASAFGIAPNRLSDWANKRAEIIEAGSTATPLQEKRGLNSLITGNKELEEVERGIPEKVATGIADVGVGIGQILLLKKATGLPFNQLLALEAAAKSSDKPVQDQLAKAAEGYAMGNALESHLSRGANAALFGTPTAAQTGYEVSQGRMSPLDAAIQTGIQATAGAVLTPSRRTKPAPSTPVEEFPVGSRWQHPESGRVATVTAKEGRDLVLTDDKGQGVRFSPREMRQAIRKDAVRRVSDEVQNEAQPPVATQRTAVEPAGVSAEAPRAGTSVATAQAGADTGRVRSGTVPVELPRKWLHADFGEVTEAPNQRKAGKGRIKVLDAQGDEHYVKQSDLTGRGNQRMIPVKEKSVEPDLEQYLEPSQPAAPVAKESSPAETLPETPIPREAGSAVSTPDQLRPEQTSVEIRHLTPKGPEPQGETYYNKSAHVFKAFDSSGKEVGRLVVTEAGNPLEVFVEPHARRQGVATKLYDTAERTLGRPIVPGSQSPDGEAFRAAYDAGRQGEPAENAQSASPVIERSVLAPNSPTEGAGTAKHSKLSLGVEAKAIEAKLTKGFEDLPEYEPVKVTDQANQAAHLLKTDPDKAVRIALGQERPEGGLLPESVFVAVENQALKNKDVDLLRDLATASTLPGEATGMGQRISMLAARNPESAVSAMRDVQLAREKVAKERLGDPKKVVSRVKTEVEVEMKKTAPKARDWAGFLETVKCK